MSLMQLVAVDNRLGSPIIANRFVEENTTLDFHDLNTLCIPRNGDMLQIKYLMFVFNEQFNISTNNWRELINGTKLEILGGGSLITSIPLDLLCEINKPMITNNKLVITIPNYFTFDFLLIGLQHSDMRLNIRYNGDTLLNNIIRVSLFAKYEFYEQNRRIEISQNSHTLLVQNFGTDYTITNVNNTMRIKLNDITYTKGYFIHGNINNIKKITLLFNGYDRYVYDHTMMHLFCNKISDNLLCVPFVYNDIPDFVTNTEESYHGSLFSGRIDAIELRIEFEEVNERNLRIYSVNKYIVKVMNGIILIIEPTVYVQTRTVISQITWTEENKTINDRNNECPISYIEFTTGSKYCCCSTCATNYDEQTLKNYFSSNSMTKKCPTCRSIWDNFIVYTNCS